MGDQRELCLLQRAVDAITQIRVQGRRAGAVGPVQIAYTNDNTPRIVLSSSNPQELTNIGVALTKSYGCTVTPPTTQHFRGRRFFQLTAIVKV